MINKKCFLPVFALHLLLLASPVVAQSVYHVNISSGDDSNDGLQWSSALMNIQPAIDLAVEGDVILVAEGVYHPTEKIPVVFRKNGTPADERHRSFYINKNVALLGGFPRNSSDATVISDRDWQLYRTVLSGDFDENDGYDFENMDENAYHVVVLINASPSLVLNGFQITGGCADDASTSYLDENQNLYVTGSDGGGIYAYSRDQASSPTITDVSFYGNYAQDAGGAMFNFSYANDASPQMTNVSIVHNKAKYRHGGGLFNNAGGAVYAKLTNLNVVGNESTMSGGGLYFTSIEKCSPVIVNAVVNGNLSNGGNGGGIYISTFSGDAEPVITNTTICGNSVKRGSITNDGGGLVVLPVGVSKTSILNTVIWGNKGIDIDNFHAESKDWGEANIISGSFIEGFDGLGTSNLPGNIDPKFLEPVLANLAPTIDGDYQLMPGSPLINKGLNASITVSTDLLGNTRIFDGTVDIGAYEFQGVTPIINETITNEKTIWCNSGCLYVRINESATLRVYALDGTLVKHIHKLDEGLYEFPIPRGFYVVTLSNGITEKIAVR